MATLFPVPATVLANAHRHWRGRTISLLQFPDDGFIETKSPLIDEIIAYSEPGQMAPVIWFEVRYVDGSVVRHNGTYVASVVFEEIKDAPQT